MGAVQQMLIGGSGRASVEFGTSSEISAAQPTYTFTNLATPGPGLIVVAIHAENGSGVPADPSSVTIGGVAATKLVSVTTSAASAYTGLWASSGVSGSTATVFIDFSAADMSRCEVGSFRVTGHSSATPAQTKTYALASGNGTVSLAFTLGNVAIYAITAGNAALGSTAGMSVEDYAAGVLTFYRGGRVTSSASAATVTNAFTSNAQGVSAVGATW
jgi:hypothetical protein